MTKIFIVIGILAVMAGLVVWLCLTMHEFDEEFDVTKVTGAKYDLGKELLTFKGGKTGQEYTFRGYNTVWRSLDGKRADAMMESKLCDIWHKCKNSEQDEC